MYLSPGKLRRFRVELAFAPLENPNGAVYYGKLRRCRWEVGIGVFENANVVFSNGNPTVFILK